MAWIFMVCVILLYDAVIVGRNVCGNVAKSEKILTADTGVLRKSIARLDVEL